MTTDIDNFDERCSRVFAAALQEHDQRAAESGGPREPFTLTLDAVKNVARTGRLRTLEQIFYIDTDPPEPPKTEDATVTDRATESTPTPRAIEAFQLTDDDLAGLDALERAALRLIVSDDSRSDVERLPTKARKTAQRLAEGCRRLARHRVHIDGEVGSVAELAEQLLLENRTEESLRAVESRTLRATESREDTSDVEDTVASHL